VNITSANFLGNVGPPFNNPYNIYAKLGVAIQYQTTGYLTNGATSMQYALHIRLEGPF